MKRVLAPKGLVVWRSDGKHPWYIQTFKLAVFEVEAVDVRENAKATDRVNSYASLYQAKKIAQPFRDCRWCMGFDDNDPCNDVMRACKFAASDVFQPLILYVDSC
jgi:hypothetical protein